MTVPGIPEWATRMRALREARGWSQTAAVEQLRRKAQSPLPEPTSVLRRWKAWESGRNQPDQFYRPLIAATLGTVTSALFPPASSSPSDLTVLAATGMDTMEIVNRLHASDISEATINALTTTVDRLCSQYASEPPAALIAEGRQWLSRLVDLQAEHLTFSQRRETLRLAGYLTLLVGCIEYDLGDPFRAESTRRSALQLGNEVGSAEIVGWAHEMTAWFTLTNGDYRATIAAAQAGQQAAGRQSVAVQLIAQEAKARARLGQTREMETALERGRTLLDSLPYPENTRNHFVVDPAKFDFYVMDCYRHSGDDSVATTLAETVIRNGMDFRGQEVSPMRIAEARITLAVAAARDGDLAGAVDLGRRAIGGERRSMPSLLMVATELVTTLTTRYDGHKAADAYVRDLRRLDVAP